MYLGLTGEQGEASHLFFVWNTFEQFVDVILGATSALHRKTVRLVDHQNRIIFIQSDVAQQAHVFFNDARHIFTMRLWQVADWRNPNCLPFGKARICLYASLVNPHFAFADNPLQT